MRVWSLASPPPDVALQARERGHHHVPFRDEVGSPEQRRRGPEAPV